MWPHCGRPITGEVKRKRTKRGTSSYRYYRCTRYNALGHPRVRVKEDDLDAQIRAMFLQLRVDDEQVRDWFANRNEPLP